MKKLAVAAIILMVVSGCAGVLPTPAAEPTQTATEAPLVPTPTGMSTGIPTTLPVDPILYRDWWTYSNPTYGFSLLLPQDWVAEEATAGDSLLNGHLVSFHPPTGGQNIRMTFRRQGEETLLWPTGVGQGEFISQGSLDIAGEPALRLLLVCPTGELTAIWYHQAEGQANIVRDGMEFGFIFTAGSHCETGKMLSGKIQQVGEMIIASLKLR